MSDNRKPFFSIADDVDDSALEAIARKKGVPALTQGAGPTDKAVDPTVGKSRAVAREATVMPANDTIHAGPTPRTRMYYVKACLPDYALAELKTRACAERVSVNHLLLKALTLSGIAIKAEDLIEDGRRLRGKAALH
ncbi:MAG: hypothetical protein JNL45_14400 [Hyphomicrobium sp.]|jgi:hypothetical protein|nr:hypothetical protein [Hyphomicrobium sp.]